jgi:hypothetical protein
MKTFLPTPEINAPYMVDKMLCKNPCYKTTHITEYKTPISTNKYSHIKSKYKNQYIIPPAE